MVGLDSEKLQDERQYLLSANSPTMTSVPLLSYLAPGVLNRRLLSRSSSARIATRALLFGNPAQQR